MGRTSDARQRLMDAAYALIWEYSYGAVTIEAICERASVKKGSFYYFFASKSELAVTAIAAWWEERKTLLDTIFQRETPPLERLRDFLDFIARRQIESYEQTGQVLGCPIYGLGAEISTQDEELRSQLQAILKSYGAYFEQAIRDAQALGLIEGDASEKARKLLYYYAGVLTQSRIENNVEAIRQLSSNGLELIGARETPAEFFTSAAPQTSLALSL
jgi:TetR/AcrR family transcriptional repressor of nem operon